LQKIRERKKLETEMEFTTGLKTRLRALSGGKRQMGLRKKEKKPTKGARTSQARPDQIRPDLTSLSGFEARFLDILCPEHANTC
jgi:hypothetical protein